jgi:hypothetical protein
LQRLSAELRHVFLHFRLSFFEVISLQPALHDEITLLHSLPHLGAAAAVPPDSISPALSMTAAAVARIVRPLTPMSSLSADDSRRRAGSVIPAARAPVKEMHRECPV